MGLSNLSEAAQLRGAEARISLSPKVTKLQHLGSVPACQAMGTAGRGEEVALGQPPRYDLIHLSSGGVPLGQGLQLRAAGVAWLGRDELSSPHSPEGTGTQPRLAWPRTAWLPARTHPSAPRPVLGEAYSRQAPT